MSVINKVLKDLDNRGGKPFADEQGSSAVATEAGSGRLKYWLVIGSLFIILLAAGGWWLLMPANETETSANISEPSVTPYKPQPATQTESSRTGKGIDIAQLEPLDIPEQQAEPKPDPEPKAESDAKPEMEPEPLTTDDSTSESTMVKEPVSLSPQELGSRHADKATDAQQQGRLSDAEKHWEKAVLVEPENPQHRQQLAALQYGRGKISQALLTLNAGLKKTPQAHRLRLLSAKILQKEGKQRAALMLLNEASPEVAQHIEYYQLKAKLAQQLERYESAADSYAQLAAAQPSQGRWYLGQAIALEQFDKTRATAAYRQALQHLNHKPSIDFVSTRLRQLEDSL